MITNASKYLVEKVPAEKIIDLRHKELRQDLPRESAMFEGDKDTNSWHFASYLKDAKGRPVGEPVCCGSFVLQEWEGKTAYRLRGMATDSRYQKQGIGKGLLEHAVRAIVKVTGIRLFWCNARIAALDFYKKQGWVIASDVFEIKTAGLHYKMFFIAE
ncbi:MAG: putative acyltransferase [Bacteroidota bacterium]|nr:putative acyltransferase [Bacteroidota bacterium]